MDYNVLFSGLIGTLVGGLITWLITRYNLNRQFNDHLKKIEIQDRKNERIAINSVLKEIEYNLIQLDNTKQIMIKKDMKFISFKNSGLNNNLTMEKWTKHSDTVEFIDGLECLSKVQAFYYNLSVEINNQITNIERTNKHIDLGLEVTKELKLFISQSKI